MTAEPRDVEEIRRDMGDLADVLGDLAGVCSTQSRIEARAIRNSIRTRLAADVEPLLDRLAAADRENAELRERLRRDAEQRREFERLYALPYLNEVRAQDFMANRWAQERDDLRAQLAAAQAQLAKHRDAMVAHMHRADAAEARLEAVRARAVAIMSSWNPGDPAYKAAQELYALALSAAPQPEPDPIGKPCTIAPSVGGPVYDRNEVRCWHEGGLWHDLAEPPASDSLARCAHGICTHRAGHPEAHGHDCVPEGCFECRPPASDEPARCEHDPRCSLNGAAAAGCHCVWHNGRHMACYPSCHAGGGCVEGFPGPAASGAPDGGL